MISIIIPTLNEASCIAGLLNYLKQFNNDQIEIIVADGGSTDDTVAIAKINNCNVVECNKRSRPHQMNEAAKTAKGKILYFLHADSIPSKNFIASINQAIEAGNIAGCFRLKFDKHHWFLNFNCWFTRFNIDLLHYGDQSLFIDTNLFNKIGGFKECHLIMEDYDMVRRIKHIAKFTIINENIKTSARKYIDNGIYKMQFYFYYIFILYKLGYSQNRLMAVYQRINDSR